MTGRRWLKNLVLLFTTLTTVFIVLELFFTFFYPQVHEHDKMFMYDSELGWTFRPNAKGHILYPGEASHYIETNNDKFRDNEFIIRSNKERILIVGDSFVSNIAVPIEMVFTEILESQLFNVDVFNLGVNGYGQTQEYLLLKDVLNRFLPSLVIVQIYIGNDFFDNLGQKWVREFNPPRVIIDEKRRKMEILPPGRYSPQITKTMIFMDFLRKIHVLKFVHNRLSIIIPKIKGVFSNLCALDELKVESCFVPEIMLCKREPSQNVTHMDRAMELLLVKIQELCNEKNIPVIFLLAPTFIQVNEELWTETLKKRHLDPNCFDITLPNKKLERMAIKNNFHIIDLYPRLRTETLKGRQLYNLKEHHWNREGNIIVADELKKQLSDFIRTNQR